MTKIAIHEYSMYGHINQLSRSIRKGMESVGAEVEHLRCAETSSPRSPGKNACSSQAGRCVGNDNRECQ